MKKELFLMPGVPTMADVDAMFKAITGRDTTTPEDHAEVEALLAELTRTTAKPQSEP